MGRGCRGDGDRTAVTGRRRRGDGDRTRRQDDGDGTTATGRWRQDTVTGRPKPELPDPDRIRPDQGKSRLAAVLVVTPRRRPFLFVQPESVWLYCAVLRFRPIRKETSHVHSGSIHRNTAKGAY